MADKDVASVARGRTFYGPSQTIPSSYAASLHMEGLEAEFKHTDPAAPETVLSNRVVRAKLMRNVSGITMVAGMGVVEKAGYEGRRFNGYTYQTAMRCVGVIDDHLYSAGVRNGDLCWVQYDGPTYARFAGGCAVSVSDRIHADTAAASTACTTGGTTADDAGKFTPWLGLTSSATETTDSTDAKRTFNNWGICLSAATTGNTGATKLVDLCIKR